MTPDNHPWCHEEKQESWLPPPASFSTQDIAKVMDEPPMNMEKLSRSLISHVVACRKERYLYSPFPLSPWPWGHEKRKTSPAPHHLQYSGEQVLHLTWKTVELTLVTGSSEPTFRCEHKRAGPTNFYHAVIWVEERCCPSLLPTTAGRKAGSKVIRVGELVLLLTCCSTQESRPFSSSGQLTSRAGPECEGCI